LVAHPSASVLPFSSSRLWRSLSIPLPQRSAGFTNRLISKLLLYLRRMRLSNKYCQAGEAAEKPFRETPLDFIDDQGLSWSTDVMAKFRIPTGPRERLLQRLANDRIPRRTGVVNVVLCILTLLYASIYLTGWNFHFPSHAEMILWRVCSVVLFGTTTVFQFVDRAMGWHRYGFWQYRFNLVFHPGKRRSSQRMLASILPHLFGFRGLSVSYAQFLASTIQRRYLIIEVFLGLRVVPKSTYTVVQWTSFLPHV
jgi:hypothetical protein